MLWHLIHNLGVRASIDHSGATLTVAVARSGWSYGSPCTVEFSAEPPGSFAVEGPLPRDAGPPWYRVTRGGAVLWLRIGYVHRSPRPSVYIDAPRDWIVRWTAPRTAETPGANP
jgi:hypothetical protein